MSHYCFLVNRINSNTTLGKEGKFQIFILVTVRWDIDHQNRRDTIQSNTQISWMSYCIHFKRSHINRIITTNGVEWCYAFIIWGSFFSKKSSSFNIFNATVKFAERIWVQIGKVVNVGPWLRLVQQVLSAPLAAQLAHLVSLTLGFCFAIQHLVHYTEYWWKTCRILIVLCMYVICTKLLCHTVL